jgi:16S rRNA (cytidine1402-2'-O)-methyltransferase
MVKEPIRTAERHEPASPGKGILYLVATPIGNLEDVTHRALRILEEADLVLAEDTRRTRKLLSHHGLRAPLRSHHEHNEQATMPDLLAMLEGGRRLALVTDAGTPSVSDPGFRLTRAAARAGHRIVPVPGPSAALAALVASGLPTDRFVFAGYPPRKAGPRRRFFEEFRDQHATLVFFESPHRIAPCLADAASVLGPDRPAALCREITKTHEEFIRDTLGAVASTAAQGRLRGEITVCVAGAPRRGRARREPEGQRKGRNRP